MYYVIQVAPREESQTELLIRERLSGFLCKQCFHLRRRMMKKFNGEWREVSEKILPGYLFIETDNIEAVYEALCTVPRFWELLGRDKAHFESLGERDVDWLLSIMNYMTNYEIPLSQIVVKTNGKVCVVSGPLQKVEHLIDGFNLHKRFATIKIHCAGEKQIYLGFGHPLNI